MKEKLDILFSKLIRLRDTDEFGNGKCFTCGKIITYDTCEAGHFRHRRHMGTRWHLDNVHAQCFECNRGDDLCQYIIAMQENYDIEVVQDLVMLSNQNVKFSKQDLVDLYAEFRELARDLLNDKMFIVKL